MQLQPLPVPDCDLDHRNPRVKTAATEDCFIVFAVPVEAVFFFKCGPKRPPWLKSSVAAF
jgi:hypothetical protein